MSKAKKLISLNEGHMNRYKYFKRMHYNSDLPIDKINFPEGITYKIDLYDDDGAIQCKLYDKNGKEVGVLNCYIYSDDLEKRRERRREEERKSDERLINHIKENTITETKERIRNYPVFGELSQLDFLMEIIEKETKEYYEKRKKEGRADWYEIEHSFLPTTSLDLYCLKDDETGKTDRYSFELFGHDLIYIIKYCKDITSEYHFEITKYTVLDKEPYDDSVLGEYLSRKKVLIEKKYVNKKGIESPDKKIPKEYKYTKFGQDFNWFVKGFYDTKYLQGTRSRMGKVLWRNRKVEKYKLKFDEITTIEEEKNNKELEELRKPIEEQKKKSFIEEKVEEIGQFVIDRYKAFKEYEIEHGADPKLFELPAIRQFIEYIIANGDGNVILDGRSPIYYSDPKEDGTFDICGRMAGPCVTLNYEMQYCNDGNPEHYIVLKRTVRKQHWGPRGVVYDGDWSNEIYINKDGVEVYRSDERLEKDFNEYETILEQLSNKKKLTKRI